MSRFQRTTDSPLDIKRTDHVWARESDGRFKCVLCGAVTRHPPPHPTPLDWEPAVYEPLTDEERQLCPQ